MDAITVVIAVASISTMLILFGLPVQMLYRHLDRHKCEHPAKHIEVRGPIFVNQENNGFRHSLPVKCRRCGQVFDFAYFTYNPVDVRLLRRIK